MSAKDWKRFSPVLLPVLLLLVLGALGPSPDSVAAAPPPGITPATVTVTIATGASQTVNKAVQTPTIPPKSDIVFLSDTTGSMGTTLANISTNIGPIMSTVRASDSDSQFAAAQYKDFQADDSGVCGPEPAPGGFNVDAGLTTNMATVNTAVGTWVAAGGCDTPEGQINALFQLATGAVTFRSGSTRIIVWDGDSSGHDPSNGHTQAQAIAALTAAGVKVIAIPVTGGGDGLNSTGQATAITSATGGVLMASTLPADVSNAIITALGEVSVTVSMASDCSTATGGVVTTTFSPASVGPIVSGSVANFVETIAVTASAAQQGKTYTCKDHALIDGNPMTDASGAIIYETKTIKVPDTTAPTASCEPTTNPSGKNVPPAGTGTGNSGQNPDGFYVLAASDNVAVQSIVVKDSSSSFVSNPFVSGDKVKITQAPGATPSDKRPGPGVIVSDLKLKGDAILTVTDTSGNVTTVSCKVPPPPK